MQELLSWLAHWEYSKTLLLFLFFTVFIGIIVYLTVDKDRSKRLESYKQIPFLDDDDNNYQADLKKGSKDHEE